MFKYKKLYKQNKIQSKMYNIGNIIKKNYIKCNNIYHKTTFLFYEHYTSLCFIEIRITDIHCFYIFNIHIRNICCAVYS